MLFQAPRFSSPKDKEPYLCGVGVRETKKTRKLDHYRQYVSWGKRKQRKEKREIRVGCSVFYSGQSLAKVRAE